MQGLTHTRKPEESTTTVVVQRKLEICTVARCDGESARPVTSRWGRPSSFSISISYLQKAVELDRGTVLGECGGTLVRHRWGEVLRIHPLDQFFQILAM